MMLSYRLELRKCRSGHREREFSFSPTYMSKYEALHRDGVESGRVHRRPCEEPARHCQGTASDATGDSHHFCSMVIHGHLWRQQRCEAKVRRVGMGNGVGHTHAPHAHVRPTQRDPDRPSRETQTDRQTDRPTDRHRHRRYVKGSSLPWPRTFFFAETT